MSGPNPEHLIEETRRVCEGVAPPPGGAGVSVRGGFERQPRPPPRSAGHLSDSSGAPVPRDEALWSRPLLG
ncbi:hypothetical protein AAFF_G00350800 [Aldrovandia affinis]|uniref:Uncharacterized protein n=1 Tax=Aldrovandia affinis TaxID=143900 RepID=A0AAD7R5S5_9TELE|nr:hypothetical protein AAFF_G00350800 [Aldrovandia affinis]